MTTVAGRQQGCLRLRIRARDTCRSRIACIVKGSVEAVRAKEKIVRPVLEVQRGRFDEGAIAGVAVEDLDRVVDEGGAIRTNLLEHDWAGLC